MAEYVERFGRRMRERRVELGLTQVEIAHRVSVTVDGSQISRWERGQVEPSADHKEAIAVALETTVADLTAGSIADREEVDETPSLESVLSEADKAWLRRVESKVDQILAALSPDEQLSGGERPFLPRPSEGGLGEPPPLGGDLPKDQDPSESRNGQEGSDEQAG